MIPTADIVQHIEEHTAPWSRERLQAIGDALVIDVFRIPGPTRVSLRIHAAIGQPLCDAEQAIRIDLLNTTWGPGLRALLQAKHNHQLAPWRLLPPDGTQHIYWRGTPAAGPNSDTTARFDQVVLSPEIGESPAHFYLGWAFLDAAGERTFLAMAPLSSTGLRRVERLAVRAVFAAEPDPWDAFRTELVRIALDPNNHHQPPGAFPPESLAGKIPEVEGLLNNVLDHINMSVAYASPWNHHYHRFKRTRWAREQIAKARSKAGLKSLIKAIQNLRYHLLSYSERLFLQAFDVNEAILEQMLPTARVLEALGCDIDAVVANATPERLARHPMGVLGLPDTHAIWDTHHPREPIQLALSWGKRHKDKSIKDAFKTYEIEQRWLATWTQVDPEKNANRLTYNEIVHGIHNLFHEDALTQTTMGELEFEPRVRQRILKAFSVTTVLSALPKRENQVLRRPGLGPGTVQALSVSLLEHARTWRQKRAQLTVVEAPRVVEQDDEQAELTQGLDELAALFGGS